MEALEARRRMVVEAKHGRRSAIEVLREVTLIFPDTTWTQRFEMDATSVTIQGSSEAASALIAPIEDSPLFRRATFTSPVTRDPVSGTEQFRLAFELEEPEKDTDADNETGLLQGAGGGAAAGRAAGRQ